MTTAQIAAQYSNLLITLAKDADEIREQVTAMHGDLKNQDSNGKLAGMRTIINARNRQRARLLQLLGRNKAALRHFFNVTDPVKVAQQKIILH